MKASIITILNKFGHALRDQSIPPQDHAVNQGDRPQHTFLFKLVLLISIYFVLFPSYETSASVLKKKADPPARENAVRRILHLNPTAAHYILKIGEN
jgi:hypothetical protein